MTAASDNATTALLLSGGLDSGILLGHLLAQGHRVRPLYVRSHLHWEPQELDAIARLLAVLESPRLGPLVVLDQPLQDVYGNHWSITGQGVPRHDTPDEAVYLPGRNALLLIKPLLWCHLHGVPELALAPLKSNPFADATTEFFAQFAGALNRATGGSVRVVRPFATLEKTAVMQLGRELPLELTFSCIDPQRGEHCGRCNKCAERQAAFRDAGLADPTTYAQAVDRATDPR
ncbi:MAG: 7-cyano-7-deazaguanine synthase [Pirellulales bacterium]|nr:7-cyano-7-deazaguanine synthase [Pirellulales bacterium]